MFHYQFSSAPLSKGNPNEVIYQNSDAYINQHLNSTLSCQCIITTESMIASGNEDFKKVNIFFKKSKIV